MKGNLGYWQRRYIRIHGYDPRIFALAKRAKRVTLSFEGFVERSTLLYDYYNKPHKAFRDVSFIDQFLLRSIINVNNKFVHLHYYVAISFQYFSLSHGSVYK